MKITAFLIDPIEKTVKPIEFDGSLDAMYEQMDCSIVATFYYENHCFFYNDWLEEREYSGWTMPDFSQLIAGKSLVVAEATDEDGKSLSADPAYLEVIQKKISWGQMPEGYLEDIGMSFFY